MKGVVILRTAWSPSSTRWTKASPCSSTCTLSSLPPSTLTAPTVARVHTVVCAFSGKVDRSRLGLLDRQVPRRFQAPHTLPQLDLPRPSVSPTPSPCIHSLTPVQLLSMSPARPRLSRPRRVDPWVTQKWAPLLVSRIRSRFQCPPAKAGSARGYPPDIIAHVPMCRLIISPPLCASSIPFRYPHVSRSSADFSTSTRECSLRSPAS